MGARAGRQSVQWPGCYTGDTTACLALVPGSGCATVTHQQRSEGGQRRHWLARALAGALRGSRQEPRGACNAPCAIWQPSARLCAGVRCPEARWPRADQAVRGPGTWIGQPVLSARWGHTCHSAGTGTRPPWRQAGEAQCAARPPVARHRRAPTGRWFAWSATNDVCCWHLPHIWSMQPARPPDPRGCRDHQARGRQPALGGAPLGSLARPRPCASVWACGCEPCAWCAPVRTAPYGPTWPWRPYAVPRPWARALLQGSLSGLQR